MVSRCKRIQFICLYTLALMWITSYVTMFIRHQENVFSQKYSSWILSDPLKVNGSDIINKMSSVIDSKIPGIDSPHQENIITTSQRVEIPSPLEVQPQVQKIESLPSYTKEDQACEYSTSMKEAFSSCKSKMDWMRKNWKIDPCYAEYGVDGSTCSIRKYLSEVESHCSLLQHRIKRTIPIRPLANNTDITNTGLGPDSPAELKFNLKSLLDKLVNPGHRPNYNWIRQHIQYMWSTWEEAGKAMLGQPGFTKMKRSKKNIFIYLGLLSNKSGFKIAEGTLKGGALGEVKQWSDALCTLHMLGHDITVASEYEQLQQLQQSGIKNSNVKNHQCDDGHLYGSENKQPRSYLYDIIYTDITGIKHMIKKNIFNSLKCTTRVLDSFGTEPAYNHKHFATLKRKRSPWGSIDLDPQQFYTMFPHSPDNSFMGFVVENHLKKNESSIKKENIALVYGKSLNYYTGKKSYLKAVQEVSLEVHGTVFQKVKLPNFLHNHGVLPGDELQSLLKKSKIFIGLGFPYEGPGPLEAISQGNVFINPKFNPPHSRENKKFFKNKPTDRGLTSQNPYMEMFVGEPYVQTVDITDLSAVKTAVKQALSDIDKGKVTGFTPYEYTPEGMLQRLSVYLQKQNFCDKSNDLDPWPPKEAVHFVLSEWGKSCADACWEKGLICERSHFKYVNKREVIESVFKVKCNDVSHSEDIHFPALKSGQCILQGNHMLFSCVGSNHQFQRACPCRTYIKQQTALCHKCL